jgi:metallo-beta-lactamase class B
VSARRGRWWSIGITVLVVVIVVMVIAAVVLFPWWRTTAQNGGQQAAEPFRIAGNLYYVGASDTTAFLIASPQGHVLIDGGYPGTAKMIMASIAKLGFDIKDVKILLNTEPAYGSAGGLAELQEASGAKLWASEANAAALEGGGADPGEKWSPNNLFVWAGLQKYEAPRVDHRFKDGEKIRLGPIELTALITPGGTRGCTTLSFPVHDGDRVLNVVHACSVTLGDPLAPLLPGIKLVDPQRYAEIRAGFESSFKVLRSLPVDIWVTSHARQFGRYRKFVESANAKNPVDPFIDRAGYLEYIDKGEKKIHDVFAEQQGSR